MRNGYVREIFINHLKYVQLTRLGICKNVSEINWSKDLHNRHLIGIGRYHNVLTVCIFFIINAENIADLNAIKEIAHIHINNVCKSARFKLMYKRIADNVLGNVLQNVADLNTFKHFIETVLREDLGERKSAEILGNKGSDLVAHL